MRHVAVAAAVVASSALSCSQQGAYVSPTARSSAEPTSTSAAPQPSASGSGSAGEGAGAPSCPVGYKKALGPGHHTGFFSAGQARSFDLLLPPAKFTGPRPLLVAFHGTGMTGAMAIADYHLREWSDAGFIVVAPDTNGNGKLWPVWDSYLPPGEKPAPNADLALFDDLLQCVTIHHSVDPKRLFVGGQSAGGAMTHYVLARRSDVLAGGIPASGFFDFTQPIPQTPIEPLTVIVTWGGNNDIYSGGAGAASLTNMGYAEQSAMASQYWERQPGTHQVACRGRELGHVWLGSINAWMRDFLLAHPKGAAVKAGESLPPLPVGAPVACSEDAATWDPPVRARCDKSAAAGCQAYCQLLGTCLVENGTLGPVLIKELGEMGFANTTNVCGGCVSACEADAKDSKDTLSCLATEASSAKCGPGAAGVAGLQTIDRCCQKGSSKLCSRMCSTFKKVSGLASVLPSCK